MAAPAAGSRQRGARLQRPPPSRRRPCPCNAHTAARAGRNGETGMALRSGTGGLVAWTSRTPQATGILVMSLMGGGRVEWLVLSVRFRQARSMAGLGAASTHRWMQEKGVQTEVRMPGTGVVRGRVRRRRREKSVSAGVWLQNPDSRYAREPHRKLAGVQGRHDDTPRPRSRSRPTASTTNSGGHLPTRLPLLQLSLPPWYCAAPSAPADLARCAVRGPGGGGRGSGPVRPVLGLAPAKGRLRLASQHETALRSDMRAHACTIVAARGPSV